MNQQQGLLPDGCLAMARVFEGYRKKYCYFVLCRELREEKWFLCRWNQWWKKKKIRGMKDKFAYRKISWESEVTTVDLRNERWLVHECFCVWEDLWEWVCLRNHICRLKRTQYNNKLKISDLPASRASCVRQNAWTTSYAFIQSVHVFFLLLLGPATDSRCQLAGLC